MITHKSNRTSWKMNPMLGKSCLMRELGMINNPKYLVFKIHKHLTASQKMTINWTTENFKLIHPSKMLRKLKNNTFRDIVSFKILDMY
jgi:hypothetical protein